MLSVSYSINPKCCWNPKQDTVHFPAQRGAELLTGLIVLWLTLQLEFAQKPTLRVKQ